MKLLFRWLGFFAELLSGALDVVGVAMLGTADFKRSFQLDDYSCGPRSAYMIVRHFGIWWAPYLKVKKDLKTTEDGVTVRPILQFFRKHKLKTRYMPTMYFRDLKAALSRDAVVMVHVDGDHLAVVHGVTDSHVYLADPSVMRTLGRRITKETFFRRWSRWGITVRQ